MSKYTITFFTPMHTMYFNTDKYEVLNGTISFMSIPNDVKTLLVGSFMIEERTVYEKETD